MNGRIFHGLILISIFKGFFLYHFKAALDATRRMLKNFRGHLSELNLKYILPSLNTSKGMYAMQPHSLPVKED